MTMNTDFESWNFEHAGRVWEVTEREERWEPDLGHPFAATGVHTWSFEKGEVTQDLYSWRIQPLMHREDVQTKLVQIINQS